MNKSLSNLILIFSIFIFPLIFWIDFTHYIEFLIFSIFAKIILYFSNKYSIRNKNLSIILNYAQSLYSCIIIIIVSQATNNNGFLDLSFLIGDTSKYHLEAIKFSELSYSLLSFVEITEINYYFYQYYLSIFYQFFESKFLIGLLCSAFVGLFNLIILSNIVSLISKNQSIIDFTIIFYLISPHIIASSTTILKDNLIVFSFLLLVYSFYSAITSNKFYYYIYMLISFLLIFLLRLPFVYLFIAILIFLFIYTKKIRVSALIYLSFIFILLGVEGITNFSTKTFSADESIVSAYNAFSEKKYIAELEGLSGSGATSFLVSGYNSAPFPIKIIRLPLVVLNQYLTPFNIFEFDHKSFWSYININMKIIWLLFLGPLFLFSILNLRLLSKDYKSIFIIGVAGYIFIAHIQTGMIPRYALCFMTLALIPMAKVFYEIKTDNLMSLKYRYFNLIYYGLSVSAFIFYLIFFKL